MRQQVSLRPMPLRRGRRLPYWVGRASFISATMPFQPERLLRSKELLNNRRHQSPASAATTRRKRQARDRQEEERLQLRRRQNFLQIRLTTRGRSAATPPMTRAKQTRALTRRQQAAAPHPLAAWVPTVPIATLALRRVAVPILPPSRVWLWKLIQMAMWLPLRRFTPIPWITWATGEPAMLTCNDNFHSILPNGRSDNGNWLAPSASDLSDLLLSG